MVCYLLTGSACFPHLHNSCFYYFHICPFSLLHNNTPYVVLLSCIGGLLSIVRFYWGSSIDGGRLCYVFFRFCFDSSKTACPSGLAKYSCILGSRRRAIVSITKSGMTVCVSSVLLGGVGFIVPASFILVFQRFGNCRCRDFIFWGAICRWGGATRHIAVYVHPGDFRGRALRL